MAESTETAVDARIVFVTCPPGKAKEIARVLVEERLVACVNIVPGLSSVYFWDGKVQDDGEELMIIKTMGHAWDELQKRIKQVHPYDLPEMIYFQIEGGYHPYLNWIESSVKTSEKIGG